MKKQQLKISLENDVLNISIGTDVLKASIESGYLDVSCSGEFVITDKKAFLTDFVNELKSEDESGATPLHRLFDTVALESFENGGAGCDVLEEE